MTQFFEYSPNIFLYAPISRPKNFISLNHHSISLHEVFISRPKPAIASLKEVIASPEVIISQP